MLTSLWPCSATTSARIFWNLPPQALFDAGGTTSLWRITQVALALLLVAIVGPISLKMFKQASPKTHLRLANPRRRRKQAVNYPTQRLS
jgi:hypothetical protein